METPTADSSSTTKTMGRVSFMLDRKCRRQAHAGSVNWKVAPCRGKGTSLNWPP
jgi:hypothetical protein